MALVKEGEDLVALLPLCDLGPNSDNLAGAVGAGYYWEVEREGIHSPGDDEIAVVERGAEKVDEDLMVAGGGDGSVLVDEAVEALVGSGDEPLLLGLGDRHCDDW